MYLPFTILLPFVFTILSPYFVSLTHSKVARLGISTTTRPTETVFASADNSDLNFFYYDQNLDHFTFTPKSYQTFQQRYVINAKHWAGFKANAPILAFLGRKHNGPRLKALLVYIEHRYYGKSVPFGSAEEALKNASTLGYLNGAQALAMPRFSCTLRRNILRNIAQLSSSGDPIWWKLKYPHIALGALASSAPLLYFEDTRPKFGYYHIITKVFKDIKLILRRFGSNIIFSNGLADPYSVGGLLNQYISWAFRVLENVSGTVVALKTLNGTHCQDLSSRRKDDPKWLVMQREKEIKTIESWISTYQKDLRDRDLHEKVKELNPPTGTYRSRICGTIYEEPPFVASTIREDDSHLGMFLAI
ncbi:hypothetical protein BRARA_B01002 [Brassica rapa]|uniref:Uncharacterized protein n=1 Tax=Brassica campestris TaxID=3711 RepID=A0A398A7T9_BRACM|nr:hypothetical protein BRARA_B01002 [Brassica rapa]